MTPSNDESNFNSAPAPIDTARWLIQQHIAREPFVPFAAPRGIATLAAAYAVQRDYARLRREASKSGRIAGYKIGLTSKAMQAMCAIDSPVAGEVLADQVHRSGVSLGRSDYGRFGIEFEIAVRMGRDLRVSSPSASANGFETAIGIEAVAAAVDAVCPAIEIVDDRHCVYKTLDVLSLVADNAWNAGIVLGEFRSTWPELSKVQGALHVDDADVALAKGTGSDVLGHPFAPVAWLAGHLAQRGEYLRAGDIVMTGSMITTRFPEAPGHWRFEVSGIGSVELQVL